jgi:hypothetical protein
MATNIKINDPVFDTVNTTYKASFEDLLYQLQLIAQGGGGGGGGDASASNQLTQITSANATNSLLGVSNSNLTAIALDVDQTVAELVLIKNQEILSNSKLDTIITNTGTPVAGGATSANQTLEITALNNLIANNSVLGAINLFNLNTQLLAIVAGVNNTATQTTFLNGSQDQFINNTTAAVLQQPFKGSGVRNKYLTIQISPNVGAVSTLNIEFRASSLAGWLTLPMTDRQATFLGALINPPYNVAGAKMYTIDLTGLYEVRITPSVLSASYTYQMYYHN